MKNKVVVVGAGWAGLAAAIELSHRGKEVLILEAAPQAGGRARSIHFTDDMIDNGQHLFIGAYEHTLALMRRLGLAEKKIFTRQAFRLYMHQENRIIDLSLRNLRSPFNLISGLMLAKGLKCSERLAIMRFGLFLHQRDFQIKDDISVAAVLQQTKQPLSLIKGFWEPIALAALSTPIEHASAKVFLEVMRKTFRAPARNADLLFAQNHLNALVPDPAIQYLTQRGNQILYHERVQSLYIENNQCMIKTNTKDFKANAVILATPPTSTAAILQNIPRLKPLCQQLQHFEYESITTVYFKYAKPLNLPFLMIGFAEKTAQWIFNRNIADQNILSIVITGSGVHNHLTHQELIEILETELASIYPALKHPLDARVVCEKRAAFSCKININAHRPTTKTALDNLVLAGDYTQTGFPATLEGAILSGIKAAKLIS